MAETTDRVSSRPPYSYVGLITYAIHMSPSKKMTLWEIRGFLTKHFPTVFPPDSSKLKTVLRSQLSHNSCFHRDLPDKISMGNRRSSYWCVDLNLVDEATFQRRVYRTKFAETWPDEIHTYLDVAKIVLPTKLKSNSDDAVNQTHHNHDEDKSLSDCSIEPACKRPRTDLTFGIDRILSESFGCNTSVRASSEIIDRPSCAFQDSPPLPSFPMDYSVEHPRLEGYPSCSYNFDAPFLTSFESLCSFPSISDIHSFDSEFLHENTMIETSMNSEALYVMNSTRINPDGSDDSLDFPLSPIDHELDDDTVERSSCLYDMINDLHDADVFITELPTDDIDVIVPSLQPGELSPFEDLLAYLTVDNDVPCSFSDLLDADSRQGV